MLDVRFNLRRIFVESITTRINSIVRWFSSASSNPIFLLFSLLSAVIFLSAVASAIYAPLIRFNAQLSVRQFNVISANSVANIYDIKSPDISIDQLLKPNIPAALNLTSDSPDTDKYTIRTNTNQKFLFKAIESNLISIDTIQTPANSSITFKFQQENNALEILVREKESHTAKGPKHTFVSIVWKDGTLQEQTGSGNILEGGVNRLMNLKLTKPSMIIREPLAEWNFVRPFDVSSIGFTRNILGDNTFPSFTESQINSGTLNFNFANNPLPTRSLSKGQILSFEKPDIKLVLLTIDEQKLVVHIEGTAGDVFVGRNDSMRSVYPSLFAAAQATPWVKVALGLTLSVLLACVGALSRNK